jgi:hypothetical protein
MKTKYSLLLMPILLLFILISCEEDNDGDRLKYLIDFCGLAPEGWKCEIVENAKDSSKIPRLSPKPLAIVTYNHPERFFSLKDSIRTNPSLILNIHEIKKKESLIQLIENQEMYSWCIPSYYGETDKFFVMTSPCFINGGNYSQEANQTMSDLHLALRDNLKDFNRQLFEEIIE